MEVKELSIEEKARRYDEAIEVINRCETDKYGCVIGIKPSDIFSELKESKDEEIRKNLIELFHDTVSNDEIFSDYGLDKIEVLTWLEKRGEQKIAEWSEEDERERKRIIGLLEGWLSTFKETCYAEDCKCGIVWLKSIKDKYTWKPSSEQMDAVKSAALDVAKFSSRSEQLRLENEPYYKALVSLCNDLEKLREE